MVQIKAYSCIRMAKSQFTLKYITRLEKLLFTAHLSPARFNFAEREISVHNNITYETTAQQL